MGIQLAYMADKELCPNCKFKIETDEIIKDAKWGNLALVVTNACVIRQRIKEVELEAEEAGCTDLSCFRDRTYPGSDLI